MLYLVKIYGFIMDSKLCLKCNLGLKIWICVKIWDGFLNLLWRKSVVKNYCERIGFLYGLKIVIIINKMN